jgi:diacylglycerol O-acyltransferase
MAGPAKLRPGSSPVSNGLPPSSRAPEDLDEASDKRVLEVAADLVCTPLPRHQPLWAARWVTGLTHDRAALILVRHHAITDGVAGLAVLAALGDDSTDAVIDPFPQPPPPLRSVAAATWRDRAVALTTIPSRLRSANQGLHELGFRARRPKLAARTSLNRPTGPRRRLTTVELPLMPLLEVAHRRGFKLNDVVLAAVTGALAAVLRRRGEEPGELVVSVPISARRATTANQLGNQTGVVPLAISHAPASEVQINR